MMKRLLLGGTAMVGAAAIALPASAGPTQSGDNYTVTLGGRYDYSIMWYDQDISTGKGRGYGFTGDEAEIYIRAKATADNGITYGVNIELNANGDDTAASDEIYAIVENQSVWGRVELGNNDSAAERMYVDASDILAGRAGWDSSEWEDTLNAGAALITSDNDTVSDATKVIYFSPRFAGFQLGASLTPDRGVNGRTVFIDNNGTPNNVWDLGANWEGKFGEVGLIVSGTYETGSRPNAGSPAFVPTEDTESYAHGANVSFGDFEAGAGYVNFNDTGLTTAAATAGADAGWYWNAGVAYGMGPWKVSIGYYYSEVANGVGIADTTTDFYVLGVTYTVAPGWRLQADFDYVKIDNQNAAPAATSLDNDYQTLIVSNRFDF